MTPEAQRIAIAEACGWHIIEGEPPTGLNKNWTHSDFRFIPDYLNDLDAMHEAERLFDSDQAPWLHQLQLVVLGRDAHGSGHLFTVELAQLIRATSAQRAEAFLRTLNLWTSA